MDKPLKNDRHEKFAQNLAEGMTIDAAYSKAGFKPNRGNAARMNANESVRARVASLQAKAADAAVLTAHDIARQLDEDRAFAKEMEAPGAMVAATMGKAKVLGLIVDKTQHTGAINITINPEDAAL